ncbi:MAG: signal transduction histidine kinase [Panacagrimonas sp.]|jgi:signal transduction histidine kinase|nr:HAMP domain-containing sensor histidine kinase [Panacagrimonas sp.]MCC2658720.1 signal transduction histidine kinase [Panacagrimonas sp.]
MRPPSLLRALVVRLTLVVVLALAGSYLVLYAEFRDGLMGLEGQSIAVQVQDLRGSIVPGAGPPRLELSPSLQAFYAQPDALNGYQLLRADGTVLQSGGFSASHLPLPAARGGGQIVMQRETDASSGHSIMAAALVLDDRDETHWLRVVRNLEDAESLVAQLMLGALDELFPPIALLLIAVVSVVVVTVLTSLRSLRAVSHQASRLSLHRLDERLHAKNLPRELVPLVQAVNASLDRLEADYRVQREFTANAAHELRTPLATLRARLETRFSAQQLGDVALEIDQLARLVEQLLCLARLDSQEQLQFAAFDAYAVALEAARELAPVALESEHYVTAATPDAAVPTHGNATLTRLVFRNLIENAIQYTPAGTSITLSADSGAVIIADDGPGIAAHAATTLFERFRRGPNASGPGAGLGLAIAKCIMERQGGRLLLDANSNRGARFVMEFPKPL